MVSSLSSVSADEVPVQLLLLIISGGTVWHCHTKLAGHPYMLEKPQTSLSPCNSMALSNLFWEIRVLTVNCYAILTADFSGFEKDLWYIFTCVNASLENSKAHSLATTFWSIPSRTLAMQSRQWGKKEN